MEEKAGRPGGAAASRGHATGRRLAIAGGSRRAGTKRGGGGVGNRSPAAVPCARQEAGVADKQGRGRDGSCGDVKGACHRACYGMCSRRTGRIRKWRDIPCCAGVISPHPGREDVSERSPSQLASVCGVVAVVGEGWFFPGSACGGARGSTPPQLAKLCYLRLRRYAEIPIRDCVGGGGPGGFSLEIQGFRRSGVLRVS